MRAMTSRGSNGVFRSGATRPRRSSSSCTGGATSAAGGGPSLRQLRRATMRRPRRMASRSSAARWSESPEIARVHLGPAERLVVGLLARGHLQQRRTGEEHLGPLLDHDDVVGHPRQVGAAGRRVAEDEGDRRDAVGRRPRQVAERAPAGDEDVLLGGQVGAAGLDEVDRRQAVLEGDVGSAERLAQRERVARPALHRRVAGADQALDTADDADAGDDAGADGVRRAVGGERAELEERRVLVEEQLDALAGEQLAALVVALGVLRPAAGDRLGVLGVDLGELGEHRLAVGGELAPTPCRGRIAARSSPTPRSGRPAIHWSIRRTPTSSQAPKNLGVTAAAPRGCRRGASAATRRAPWPAGRSGRWRRRLRRAAHR